ncbi:uncharacterized protein [Diadema antillarum]|uniref:uncharacterized protein n=1 Tax=Diadema antillarum TaxID=105358 RepID=UPI003A8AE564
MLVCGEPPFNETNDSETLTKIMDCEYHMPEHLSEECQSLISKMLVRKPERRMTLREIENDPWLHIGRRTRRPSDPVITREQISEQLHGSIMDIMLNGKMADRKSILESIEKDRYDHLSATYFLLAERKLKKQKEERLKFSASDIRRTMGSPQPRTGSGGQRRTQEEIQPDSAKPGINNNGKQAAPVQPSTTPTSSKPVAIPGATGGSMGGGGGASSVGSGGGRYDARQLEDSPLSNSPRRHLIEREHLTIHPRHGRSIVKEGLGSLDEDEYQHVAEDEDQDPMVNFDDLSDPHEPTPPSSAGGAGGGGGGSGGGRQSNNSNRSTLQSKICTSVLNQITEEEDEYESDEDRGMLRRLPPRDTRQHKTITSTDNVRQIKPSSKKFTPPPRGGYSSSDASDDDSESRRRSDRFDLPNMSHRRGSRDGPPSSGSEGGGGNAHGGGGASGGGKQNGSAGKASESGTSDGNSKSGSGTKGSGKERKKSNELRESLKMSNLSVNSSNSSSSYSISKYAIDPANNTPSDSDDPNADSKTWSRKNNLRKDNVTRSDSNLYIIPKNGEKPKHVHASPSKASLKRDSSNLSEKLNLDLNSNLPRRTSKEGRDIRKKRNRIISTNGHDGRTKKDPNKKVESNCCRLI